MANATWPFVKALFFSTPTTPAGKAIVVVQDDVGWYYLFDRVLEEGMATPISSIGEVEIHVDEKLTLVREMPFSRKKNHENDSTK
jgi:hypothetical protein